MSDAPCCAHLHVEYRSEDSRVTEEDARAMNVGHNPDSPYPPVRAGALMTRGWWACRDCATTFAPLTSGASSPQHQEVTTPEPDYAAAVQAFRDRIAFWAPEMFASPDHIEELVYTVVDAARPTPERAP